FPGRELATVEVDGASQAFVPRGLTLNSRPTILYGGGPPGLLTVDIEWDDGSRHLQLELPDTTGQPVVELEWPFEAPLPSLSTVGWQIERASEVHQAAFASVGTEQRREAAEAFARFLNREVPGPSREFFRAHYYLNKGYLAKAAFEFARLHRRFPD